MSTFGADQRFYPNVVTCSSHKGVATSTAQHPALCFEVHNVCAALLCSFKELFSFV